jgi:hypothetical protein
MLDVKSGAKRIFRVKKEPSTTSVLSALLVTEHGASFEARKVDEETQKG